MKTRTRFCAQGIESILDYNYYYWKEDKKPCLVIIFYMDIDDGGIRIVYVLLLVHIKYLLYV